MVKKLTQKKLFITTLGGEAYWRQVVMHIFKIKIVLREIYKMERLKKCKKK